MIDYTQHTKHFYKNDEEETELWRRNEFDKEPILKHLHAIYCVAGTKDTGGFRGSMRESLTQTAKLHHAGYAPLVLALRGTTKHGYAGFDYVKSQLEKLGVFHDRIVPVDLLPEDEKKEQLNTYTEAKALIAYCRAFRLRIIYIVDAYFHQQRASTTIISNLDLENPDIFIFNKIAEPPPRNVLILHSQGVLADTLEVLKIRERARLLRYHDEGFLLSCAEVLEYYRKRDELFKLS